MPDPSDLAMTWMLRLGNFSPGVGAPNSAASHQVSSPMKMRPSTAPDRRSALIPTFANLTTETTPVMTVGNMASRRPSRSQRSRAWHPLPWHTCERRSPGRAQRRRSRHRKSIQTQNGCRYCGGERGQVSAVPAKLRCHGIVMIAALHRRLRPPIRVRSMSPRRPGSPLGKPA